MDAGAVARDITVSQASHAYGKLQEHFNRIIQAVANAFPPHSYFALFMGQLQKRPECLAMQEFKLRWNYIVAAVSERVNVGQNDGED